MASVVAFLLSVGGIALSLALCGIWLLVSPRSRPARRVFATVAAGFWLASTYAVPHAVGRMLSYGYRPLAAGDVPSGSVAVVLLGSGSVQVRDWDDRQLAVPEILSLSRLAEAERVFRLVGATQLISSGGIPSEEERLRPAGRTMADALIGLGVPPERIRIEARSRNTRDEALIVADMLADRPADHVVLVTSRIHMRRSMGAFRAVGLRPLPAIARDATRVETWWENLLPSDKGLREAAHVSHEVLGLAAYGVRGWYRF